MPASAGLVVAGELGEVGLAEAFVGVPQRGQRAGWQRQLHHDVAQSAARHLVPGVVQHAHVVAGHRHARRAVLDRQQPQPHGILADRRPRLGLPPVVDDGHAELLLGPFERRRIGPLAGEEKRAETREVVFLRRSCRSGSCPLMARNAVGAVNSATTPCSAMTRQKVPASGVPTGLPSNRTVVAAGKQRRVDDVAVADDPAHIRRRPEDLAGIDAVDSFFIDHCSITACGRHCRAPRPWAGRSCRRYRARRADRSPSRERSRHWRRRLSRAQRRRHSRRRARR